ncbi:MAG: tyrosine-type recombinase/integrase [Actinomycetota bacterium]
MSIRRRDTKKGVRYDVRLRGPDGREASRTFRTERDARLFEAEQRTTMQRGGWIDPRSASTPFADVAAEWLDSNPSKRPSTLARDDVTLRIHLLPPLGNRPIGQVTPAEVQALVKHWVGERKPSSVARDYRTLAAIFNYAVEHEFIARSPCRKVKLPSDSRRHVHVVDADELARLDKAMGAYGPMAYLAAVLGLRWGEVAGLRLGRVDLDDRVLVVAEQVTRGEGGRIFLGAPKSDAGRRTLAMPPALADLLEAHVKEHELVSDAALLFTAPDGGPLHYGNWYHRVWEPAIMSTGLDGLTFHDLRRANATGLVAAGVDVKTAQTRLGHSSSRLTLELYAQSVARLDREAAEVLGAAFMPDFDDMDHKSANRARPPVAGEGPGVRGAETE